MENTVYGRLRQERKLVPVSDGYPILPRARDYSLGEDLTPLSDTQADVESMANRRTVLDQPGMLSRPSLNTRLQEMCRNSQTPDKSKRTPTPEQIHKAITKDAKFDEDSINLYLEMDFPTMVSKELADQQVLAAVPRKRNGAVDTRKWNAATARHR